jgi:hypothetical protein
MIIGGFSYRCLPILLVSIVFLPGCRNPEKEQLRMRPLTALIDYYDSAQGVTLRIKKLDAHDCESLFGKRSHRLFKKFRKRQPIWPIQFSLTNDTSKLISLKASDISLPQMSYKQVASRLQKNSLTQVFGTIASSLLIGGFLAMGSFLALSASGIMLLTTGSFSITAPFAVIGSSALAAIPTFLILGTPILSTIRGVQTSHTNQIITRDIKNYSLKNQLVVEPHTTVDMVVFVSKFQYKPQFTVHVSDPENAEEKITFHVTIPNATHEFIVR